jgi:hypothetical protein
LDFKRIELLKQLRERNFLIFTDLRKAEGALKDIFPDMPKLANTLLLAIKIGVVKELESKDNNLPAEVALPKIALKLTESYGIKEEDAMEAVGIWAIVCGKATEETVGKVSSRFILANRTDSSLSQSSIDSISESSTDSAMSKETRKCPFCGETIKARARICRYCRADVAFVQCDICSTEYLESEQDCPFCKEVIQSQLEQVEEVPTSSVEEECQDFNENDLEQTDRITLKTDENVFLKPWFLLPTVFIILFSLYLCQTFEDEDSKFCNEAVERGNAESYKAYLDKFPKGKCANDIRKRYNDITKVIYRGGNYEVYKHFVKNTRTGHFWQRGHSNKIRWQSAASYCKNLSLAGKEDWRLPSVSDYKTIIYGCKSSSYVCGVNDRCLTDDCWSKDCFCSKGKGSGENGFYWKRKVWSYRGDEVGRFWTSSADRNDVSKAWFVRFDSGGIGGYEKNNSNYVKCIR